MKVTCANCGEELMGAVNRCWRCGTAVVSRPGSTSLPPVRRGPVEPIQADFAQPAADAGRTADVVAAPQPVAVPQSVAAPQAVAAPNEDGESNADTAAAHEDSEPGPIATREQFAPAEQLATAQRVAPANAPPIPPSAAAIKNVPAPAARPNQYADIPRPAYYPKHTAATGGAVGAMVLAAMSLGFAYFTIGAVFTALLGIGLGAWGVYSNYRGLAVAAMGLCCLAVVLAAVFGAIHLYQDISGGALPFLSSPVE